MKKFLLSSIIMLGVCGVVNAQTSGKTKKNEVNPTSTSAAATPTPQKAAIMPSDEAAVAAPVASDATATDATASKTVAAKTDAAKTDAAKTVNAAGEVIVSQEANKAQIKAAAAKAANEKKNQQ